MMIMMVLFRLIYLKDCEVLNGQTGIIVSYHETIEDAENNANSITDLYTNTTADNQIYMLIRG